MFSVTLIESSLMKSFYLSVSLTSVLNQSVSDILIVELKHEVFVRFLPFLTNAICNNCLVMRPKPSKMDAFSP